MHETMLNIKASQDRSRRNFEALAVRFKRKHHDNEESDSDGDSDANRPRRNRKQKPVRRDLDKVLHRDVKAIEISVSVAFSMMCNACQIYFPTRITSTTCSESLWVH